ncbi:type II secretion system protein GspL [Vibrio hangzhouensis]|uniref:type II secretion system protein GspL n=1 Tax=Vibrio hangzhouensis TaxID=462991 RepID=UPI001C97D1ED|nr:type II secretion system protein GspL [Vibrio hangzhouensis]MBY6199078.1 type II secretion system protein GspL [Vibrio hangzhouensis]
MSEFLTVRLNSQPGSPVHWAVWSTSQQEVIASGELEGLAQLDKIKEYSQQRVTLLMLCAQDVHFAQVSIPAGGARQFETMLPFLVEDDIAQDVEDLHFTILNKQGGSASICAIDKRYLSSVLSAFAEQGIEVKKVVPDVLALPQSAQVTALALDGQWLFRTDAWSGMTVDDNWLPSVIQSDYLMSQSDDAVADVMVSSYSPLPDDIISQSEHITWQALPVEPPMALLSQGVVGSHVSLLSGEFKPKASYLKYWKVWQKVAIASAILIVALIAEQVVLVNQYEAQASAYRAESERIFRAVFPDKKRIPTVSYLKRQMQDELGRLGGGDITSASVLEWLSKLPDTVGQVNGMQVESFTFDGNRNEVRMNVTSKDFASFEAARTKLETQFDVSQGPLNRNGEVVMGNFVLKKK